MKENDIMDEGYIKFDCRWTEGPSFPNDVIKNINKCRQALYQLKLIGAYSNGIGFGNLSQRIKDNTFLISGSATGGITELSGAHYAIVDHFDINQNQVHCHGPIRASSESMSHAIIYQNCPDINAVIHVHHLKMWQKLLNQVPTTEASVSYGTPEMSHEIVRLLQESELLKKKLFVTAGHKEGIFTFGMNLEEALEKLLYTFKKTNRHADK